MENQELLEKAMETLRSFVLELSKKAGKTPEYGEELWERIRSSNGVLRELAYFHDYTDRPRSHRQGHAAGRGRDEAADGFHSIMQAEALPDENDLQLRRLSGKI